MYMHWLGLRSHETERNIIDHNDDVGLMVAWWRHLCMVDGVHIVRLKMGKTIKFCCFFFVAPGIYMEYI